MSRDVAGMWCSGLCVLHCVATPLLLGAVGLGAWTELGHALHMWFLLPIIGLALWSFPIAYRHHAHPLPLAIGAVGLVSLLLALTLSEEMEHWVTILGGVLLVSAHWINRRQLARVSSPSPAGAPS